MIVPRLRSEARGGSSSGSSTRYSNSGVYGGKVHHGHHTHDPDLKRALQYSYTSQTVRKWEKRWVVIHETSMKVHKWMPAPVTTSTLASQIVAEKTATNINDTTTTMDTNNTEQSQPVQQPDQEQEQEQEQELQPQQISDQEKPTEAEMQNLMEESATCSTHDTQMLVDEESTSQSSQT